VPDVAFDVDVEIMELAWLLRATPQTLPRRTPYLRVEADRPRGARPFTAGVVWRGGGWNPARATTAAALAPLADVPGVRLLAFDPAPTGEDLTDWPGEWAPASTVRDLARAIAATDVLISVDTLAAHLAGALGVPVWTLLNHDPDWRWMLDRDDSPWYPTMRLFRQPAPAAWPAVIGRIRAALWTAATWPALAAQA
jgi:ADP-heptose:LPS heptosyltransferase